ncbi:hypothetical protein ABW19_dt0204498 [Dactylella cylindrospora]|nr:hypothetical protein ABW19_dt0204498 [Dactylella cylindrospora]
MNGMQPYGVPLDGSCCYPLHEACWRIFTSIARTSRHDIARTIVPELFMLIGSTPYDPRQILWPHGYGDFFDVRPLIMHCLVLYPSPLKQSPSWPENDPELVPEFDTDDQGFREILKDHGYYGTEIPDVFPLLPSEIIEMILSLLEPSDLMNLAKIRTPRRITVPDAVLRKHFRDRNDLGFLDGFLEKGVESSSLSPWAQRFLLATQHPDTQSPSVKNRQRVWKICTQLMDVLDDSVDATSMNLEREPRFPYPSEAIVEQERDYSISPESNIEESQLRMRENSNFGLFILCHRQSVDQLWRITLWYGAWILSKGTIENVQADSLGASFTGEGPLQFLSGLRFFPSTEGIGHILPRREKVAALKCEDGGVLTMLLAVCRYGVTDLSITRQGSEPCWLGGGVNIKHSAIIRRFIQADSNGIGISRLDLGVDVCKITKIGLESPNMVPIADLDSTERFIQSNTWIPTIPQVEEGLSLNLQCYYDIWFNQGWPEYIPLFAADFGYRPLIRFTCWVLQYQDIVGFEFIVSNGPGEHESLKLGQTFGVAIDFPINGEAGEKISSMSLILRTQGEPICGISVGYA